jgi:very-short-patch-repair endonuclease
MSGSEGPHPDPLPEGEGVLDAPSPPATPPLPLGEDRGEGRKLARHARALRRDATPAERKLWNALRNNALGAKCRRQSPLGPYVLDFLFFTERLAVELDGESHNAASVLTRDARRDGWLRAHGVRVPRFTNRDVLTNLEGVVTAIRTALHAPHPGPLSKGEGRGEGGP